ncbi:MAG: hypothetical protein QM723_00740 [Myxococcaceae bacterium]
MSETIDPKHLDKRTAERYIQSGLLDEKVWDKYLKSLPDVAEKAAPVESTVSGEEDFDDDDDQE